MAASGLMTTIWFPNPASAATVYWDLNAETAGAGGATPTGAWNAGDMFWNPLADGTGAVAAWTAGDIAVFSAGSDATGAFTINVDGTQSIGGLRFEDGQLTLAGGTLALAADSELFVGSGLEAAVSSLFSGSARLTKTGAGTLVLSGNSTDFTGALGTNAYDNGAINLTGAFVLEALLTAAFVLVILLVTERVAAPGFAGLAIGLSLTAVHLVGIPLTGTSVNPARSLGPALFAGGDALGQVWLFILAPLVGGVIAVGVWRLIRTADAEDERLVAGSERD